MFELNNWIDLLKKFLKPELSKLVIALLIVLLKLKLALQILMLLIVIDFITGIISSLKKKERIRSNKMFNTLIKIYVYYTAILTVALIEIAISLDNNILSKATIGFAVTTEGKSIIENLSAFYLQISKLGEYIKGIVKINNKYKNGGQS